MKKQALLWMALVAVLLSLSGCQKNAKSHIQEMVEETNRQCPIPTGIGTFDRIDYADDVVTFEYTIDNQIVTIDKLNEKKKEARKIFANNLSRGGIVKEVLKEIAQADATLRLHMTEKGSMAEATFNFTEDELQQIANTPSGNDDETILQSAAMMLNLISPVEVDEVTIMTGGELTSSEFIYQYEIDDQNLPISTLTPEVIATLKANHAAQLRMQLSLPAGADLRQCLQACVNTHRSLTCRYTGKNTGRVIEYGHTPEEIKTMMGQ